MSATVIANTFRFPGGEYELSRGQTRLVGVLNVTPDSFSDGGRYAAVDAAVAHAVAMADSGAAIIDVGGVSTRPGSVPPSEAEELGRVLPVVEALASRLDVPISVDTFRSAVFRRCFAAGARILNDVSGLRDEGMLDALADTGAGAFLMHMQGDPATMQHGPYYRDVVHDISAYFRGLLERTDAKGIPRDRLAIDPGIGFGKTSEHNLEILRGLERFKALGCALLVGASRKSFLEKITGRNDPADREWATVGCTAHFWSVGVHFVRVHDVRASADVLAVLNAINPSFTAIRQGGR